jgi:filamentous hemagglutinin family protein
MLPRRLHFVSGWLTRSKSACLLFVVGTIASPSVVLGQIIPDATLPNNSTVTTEDTLKTITGGTQAGNNLFHSFERFGISAGETAYFNNGEAIANIITRVTGNQISNIDGVLAANGNANLFVLNPNGIQFGPNARLNLGGSLVASSAERLLFDDGTGFSARPEGSESVLTIAVPVGLQYGENAGKIGVNSAILAGAPDRELRLGGAEVTIAAGEVRSPGGYLEVLGITNGVARFDGTFSGEVRRGNLTFSDGAIVDASGVGAGELRLWGDRVTLQDNSKIITNTLGDRDGGGMWVSASQLQMGDRSHLSASTFGSGNGGNMEIEVSGDITLVGDGTYQDILDDLFEKRVTRPDQLSTGIFSLSFGSGSAGNLQVRSQQLNLDNGAFISTAPFATGNGGNLTVEAGAIALRGSQFFADNFGNADAGQIEVNAKTIQILEGGAIAASTFGDGRGGMVNITATEAMEIVGMTPNERFNSGMFATAYWDATEPAGNLNVTTPRLSLRGGAQIAASSFSAVAGGTVNINADTVEIVGRSPNRIKSSGLFTQSYDIGPAGDLNVTARSLLVGDGALISAATTGSGEGGDLTIRATDSVTIFGTGEFDLGTAVIEGNFDPANLQDGLYTSSVGPGKAGNLTLETRRLSVRDRGNISTATLLQGDGGNLTIRASEWVELDRSTLLTGTSGEGEAGNLSVNTGRLILRNQAAAITSTIAQGSGGSIDIKASEAIDLSDGSAILTTTEGSGDAGGLRIETGSLRVTDASGISTATSTQGKGGDLSIFASERVEITDNSSLVTATLSAGNAGQLAIVTPSLTLTNQSGITVSSSGEGDSGNLKITSDRLVLDSSLLVAVTASGQGGNIEIASPQAVTLRRNSEMSAEATGSGNGGNVAISTDVLSVLENSQIRATAIQGNGGNISILTQGLFESPDSQISASSQRGIDGVVRIDTPDLDPSQGIVPLPSQFIQASDRVFQGCGNDANRSEFIVTGRGGLPFNPDDPLTSESIWVDFGEMTPHPANVDRHSFPVAPPDPESSPPPLVEARGWTVNDRGETVLTARERGDRATWYPDVDCNVVGSRDEPRGRIPRD